MKPKSFNGLFLKEFDGSLFLVEINLQEVKLLESFECDIVIVGLYKYHKAGLRF